MSVVCLVGFYAPIETFDVDLFVTDTVWRRDSSVYIYSLTGFYYIGPTYTIQVSAVRSGTVPKLPGRFKVCRV